MEEKYRNIPGELRLLEQINDFVFPIEIWAYNDKLTRNGWRFENIESHREAWSGIPVLCAYVNGGRTIGSGHNQETKWDANGEAYQSFTASNAERIVGATSDEESDIRVELDGENKWLVAKATLYRWYARELTDKIIADAERGGVMSVSIEALVTASHMEGDVEVEDEYIPLGITLLGDGVAPAVPGAHVAMLAEMESEFKELKLRAASYQQKPNANDNPQINSNTKGMNVRMKLSKQQIRELQAKFADHTVLAGEQNDAGNVVLALMSKAGETAIYVMASLDEAIYAEKVQPVNAQVHFCAEGSEDVCVDACDMVETMSAECVSANEKLCAAQTALNEANATVERMVNAENARRLSAAKATATATLDAFNANREEKVDMKVLEALNADIEAGKFTACADENGVWTGDAMVAKEVKALCADAVMELDKATAAKRSETKPMQWGSVKQASAAPGTIGELFASKN